MPNNQGKNELGGRHWEYNPQTGIMEVVRDSPQKRKARGGLGPQIPIAEYRRLYPDVGEYDLKRIYPEEFEEPELERPEITEYAKEILRKAGEELPAPYPPPIEPPIKPPVEPSIEPASMLRRIYPELFEPKAAYPYPEIQTPEMVAGAIEELMIEDPAGFLEDLYARVEPEEASAFLRTFGVEEEIVEAIEVARIGEEKITETMSLAFPQFEPEEVIELAETDFESFAREIQLGGRTKEKQDLLKMMGFGWEDINEIFKTQKVVLDVEGVRKLVTILPDNSVVDDKGRHIGTYSYTTGEFTPYQYRLKDTWRAISAGEGDVIATAGGALKWLGAEGIGERLSEFGQFLQAQAPPDTLGEFDWDMLYNPRFWATRVPRTAVFTLDLVPAMILGAHAALPLAAVIGLGKFGTVVLASLGATAFSRPLESALEAGGVYDEAIRKGLSTQEAKDAASEVFFNNLKLAGVDVAQLVVAFAPSPFRSITRLAQSGLFKGGTIAGRLTITGLTEAGEEYYQEIIQRQALGEEIVWDAEMKEVVAMGGIMGLGLGSAGSVWNTIKSKTKDNLTPELQGVWDEEIVKAYAEGFTQEQAELRALDAVAGTEEGKTLIENVIENEKINELEKEIKPATPADEIVWEHTIENMRDEAPVIPEAVPELRVGKWVFTEFGEYKITERDKTFYNQLAQYAQENIGGMDREYQVNLSTFGAVSDVRGAKVTPFTEDSARKYLSVGLFGEGGRETLQSLAKTYGAKQVADAQELFHEIAHSVGITEETASNKFSVEHTKKFLEAIPKAKPLVVEEVEAPERVVYTEGGVPVPPEETISQGVVDEIPILQDIGARQRFRPTRKVFERMGLYETYKGIQKAEVELGEANVAFNKRLKEVSTLVDNNRRHLVFRELENPGSQVGLTFNEKRAVTFFRENFNRWADTLNLPQEKRLKNYVTHIFEADIAEQLKAKHPLDPAIARALEYKAPKTIFNPFLQKRLGATVGLVEDPFAAASAYESRQLKVLYYEPFVQKIGSLANDPKQHRAVREYLKDYSRRMAGEPSKLDIDINKDLQGLAEKIRGLPGGEALADFMTKGNPSGWASYNFTSAIYTLWLGFKPTSAIRNLSQHTLIIGEIGPAHFAEAVSKTLTTESKQAVAESLVMRSRKAAFVPGIDDSFATQWTDKFRETALWMFRQADKVNVRHAFLGGYYEAKHLLPNADRQTWIDRGDEVAADTQYLYTKMNSMAVSQTAPGRVFSILTTWSENWIELMSKWIARRPSQVYLQHEKATGEKVTGANWSTSYKAILMYMLIIGLGFAIKEKTRLKAWEYTGLTSIRYLADIAGGDFPGLQYIGAAANLVAGFVTDDERRLKEGLSQLNPVKMAGILRQLEGVASGDRDWLTLLLYLEGRDYKIKQLEDGWEKEFKAYPLFKDKDGEYDVELYNEYIRTHPNQAGWSGAKIRSQWRIDNPLIEAKMFITSEFTTLSTDKAREEVLRLIEKHDINTELIDGYEKVFGIDTGEELTKTKNRIGNLEKFVVGEEAEYFTVGNFVTELNEAVRVNGRYKVEKDGSPFTVEILRAQDSFVQYEEQEPEGRKLYRQQFPDVEALLYLTGKVQSFENPKSAEILLGLMKKYDIPPEGIQAFIEDPSRYDELFTQKFKLEQQWFDLNTEYENYGNSESPLYIEDKDARQLAREKLKEENTNWVADMRRIEAIDNDASPEIIEKWAERGETIDEFSAGSSEAMVWLLDNPDTFKWALDNKLLTDDGSDWNETILRLNVEMSKLNEESEEYRRLDYKRGAFQKDFPENLVDTYVDWYMAKRKDYEDDWFLMENPEFYDAMVGQGIIKGRDFSKIPTREENNFLQKYQALERKDYEDEWFLMEHIESYRALRDKGLISKQDFRKVPTREVFTLYQKYLDLPKGKRRLDYRYDHPDLDAWGVIAFGWVSAVEQKRREELTPTEEFAEDIWEREKKFREALEEIERKLKELTG